MDAAGFQKRSGTEAARSSTLRSRAPKLVTPPCPAVSDSNRTLEAQPCLMTNTSSKDAQTTLMAPATMPRPSKSLSCAASVGANNSKLVKIMKLKGSALQKALARYKKEAMQLPPAAIKADYSNDLMANGVYGMQLLSSIEADNHSASLLHELQSVGAEKISDCPSRLDSRLHANSKRMQKQMKSWPTGSLQSCLSARLQPLFDKLGVAPAVSVRRSTAPAHAPIPFHALRLTSGCTTQGGVSLETTKPAQRAPNTSQKWHKDFRPDRLQLHVEAVRDARLRDASVHVTHPWTLLVMLSAPGCLYVMLKNGAKLKLWVPQGAALLFRGDVLHAGAAYQQWHHRAHWYLIPKKVWNSTVETLDDWRCNNNGHVAIWQEDPFRDWEENNTIDSPGVEELDLRVYASVDEICGVL